MKKKILIPCLLFACTLTACDNGLVTKGVAFKEANITAIDDGVKNQKQNSFLKVTIESEAETEVVLKVDNEKATTTAKSTGTIKINLALNNVEISMKVVTKSGKTESTKEASVRVSKENDKIITDLSRGDTSIFKNINFENYFRDNLDSYYSWNFTIGDEIIEQAASENNISVSTAKYIVDQITDNLMVDGDVSKGTFDVGIKKEVPLTIDGVSTKYTKLKYSYEDALLQSSIIGIYASSSSGRISASTEVTAKNTYSYE